MIPSEQTNSNILDLFTNSNGSVLDLVNYWVWLQKQNRTIPELDSYPDQDKVTTLQIFNSLLTKSLATHPLTLAEYQRILEQALVLIEQVYVHRYLKSALYAVNPIEKLKLIQRCITEKSEQWCSQNNFQPAKLEFWFHRNMISVFRELRDLHTVYILPTPFQDKTAFLPFQIEECFNGQDQNSRHYIVSKFFNIPPKVTRFINVKDLNQKGLSLEDCQFSNFEKFFDQLQAPESPFKPGVVLVSWNGIPMEQAIELNAERQSGGNDDARLARGIEAMTFRPLSLTLPPEENWVVVRYKKNLTDNEIRERKIPWLVLSPRVKEMTVNQYSQENEALIALGVDAKTEENRNLKKKYFSSKSVIGQQENDIFYPDEKLKENFYGYKVNRKGLKDSEGEFGYIRLFSFMLNKGVTVDSFVEEFLGVLQTLKTKKLIIDVRGNGGGSILASEKILQKLSILCSRPIERKFKPVKFQFISTLLMQKMCQQRHEPNFRKWSESIQQSLYTGELYSKGFSLELESDSYTKVSGMINSDLEKIKDLVLIIDALCYSATDIFAAGFQDNELGKILGTNNKTGGGGANVWTHGFLQRSFPPDSNSPFMLLPKKASFLVAVRRAIRSTGNKLDDPIEDLGVDLDVDAKSNQTQRYYMQREDILTGEQSQGKDRTFIQRNQSMIAHAIQLLN